MTASSNLNLPLRSAPKSLCVLRLSAIGDVCHTLSVVRTLQVAWPATQITWIIGKPEAGLIGDSDGIEFLVYDKSSGRAARKTLKQQLAGRQFDVLLHMQNSLRSSRLSRLVDAPIKLGFDKARTKDWQWLFTSHRIAPASQESQGHVIDGLFGFAEALGVQERVLRWDISLGASDRTFAAEQVGFAQVLVISPCSSNRSRNFRNWPADRYAAVADYAASSHGMRVLLTGDNTDLEQRYGQEIICACRKANPVNLIGKTSLKQLLALLAEATAIVAPDSGPLHMAGAVGTPQIGLFAGSNPLRTGPAVDRRWMVNAYPEAVRDAFGKSVEQVAWGKRVREPDVMNRVQVDDVKKKLDAVMATRDERS